MNEIEGHYSEWEKPDTERQILCDLTYICTILKVKLIQQRVSRTVVVKGWGGVRMGDVGQQIQTSSYKMSKFWSSNIQHGNYS